MEQTIQELLLKLQKLLSLHRQLMDLVRAEKTALVQLDIQSIQDHALEKQGLLDQILVVERERVALGEAIALGLGLAPTEATLGRIILQSQAVSLKLSDQLRSVQQALQLMITRIQEQNTSNRALVEGSLERVHQMKRNLIGESEPRTNTYSATGQRQGPGPGARLLSTEV